MAETSRTVEQRGSGTPLLRGQVRIPVVALGTFWVRAMTKSRSSGPSMSLGMFLAVTFVLCVGFDLLFPSLAMYPSWQRLLPGFTWLTWPSFLLGLIETFAYGWYVALIFGPLFNFFARRWG